MSMIRIGVWTAGSRVLAHAGQFAVFLVAVRQLSAAEFGIFAMVAAWVVILSQFSIAGWPEYVMQWSGPEARLRKVLAVCLGIGLVFALFGVGASRFLRLEDTEARHLLWVLALTIPVTSLAATYAGILNLRERLIAAALATSLGELANIAVSILALLQGQGVLALAYGRLAGSLVWLLSVLSLARLLPDPRLTRAEFSEIFRFSWRIIFVRLLLNLRLYAATLVIGLYLGATDAGYFRAAQRLVSALSEVLGEPTRVLSWSLFRQARQGQTTHPVNFGPTAERFFAALLMVSIPLFVMLAVFADDLVLVVLGPNWLPAVPVVRILSVAYLLYTPGSATEAIISLAGQVRLLPYLVTGYAIVGVALTLFAARMGLAATAWAQVVASLVIFLTTTVVQARIARISWAAIALRLWQVPVALALAMGANHLLGVAGWLEPLAPALRMTLAATMTLAVYASAMAVLDPQIARHLRQGLRP